MFVRQEIPLSWTRQTPRNENTNYVFILTCISTLDIFCAPLTPVNTCSSPKDQCCLTCQGSHWALASGPSNLGQHMRWGLELIRFMVLVARGWGGNLPRTLPICSPRLGGRVVHRGGVRQSQDRLPRRWYFWGGAEFVSLHSSFPERKRMCWNVDRLAGIGGKQVKVLYAMMCLPSCIIVCSSPPQMIITPVIINPPMHRLHLLSRSSFPVLVLSVPTPGWTGLCVPLQVRQRCTHQVNPGNRLCLPSLLAKHDKNRELLWSEGHLRPPPPATPPNPSRVLSRGK